MTEKKLMILIKDLDYAYSQMGISAETSRQCVLAITGGNFSRYYRNNKGFYRLAGISQNSKKKLTEQNNVAHQHGLMIE